MKGEIQRVEARYFDTAGWDTVTCRLCAHQCSIASSRSGICGVRTNRDGRLYLDTWGKIATASVVPETILPLYHYAPGAKWLRLGMQGCNFRCTFCNTYRYSHLACMRSATTNPERIVAKALEMGAGGASFGVNEPLVCHEFVIETLAAAREAGLRTHIASNGSWMEEPFEEVLATADALTIGFKGFRDDFVMMDCGGQLDVVKQNAIVAASRGAHVELTYLVIEAHVDWRDQLQAFAEWVAGIDRSIPVVLLGLEKSFSWNEAATSAAAMREAHEIAHSILPYVYVDEPGFTVTSTHCADCGKVLVRRGEAGTIVTPGSEAKCAKCGAKTPWRV